MARRGRKETSMSKALPIALVALLALAGCETAPETRVTRTHLNQPMAPGQITVEPLLASDRGSLEFQTYASIVGAELARLGYTEAPGLHASELVATVAVERGMREGSGGGSGLRIGLGGGSYGWHGGVGGGVSFPVGARRGGVVVTRLMVQIKRRSDGSVIWEGRGETEGRAGTPAADPANAVRRIAAAMFKGFPGESGRTITVR